MSNVYTITSTRVLCNTECTIENILVSKNHNATGFCRRAIYQLSNEPAGESLVAMGGPETSAANNSYLYRWPSV